MTKEELMDWGKATIKVYNGIADELGSLINALASMSNDRQHPIIHHLTEPTEGAQLACRNSFAIGKADEVSY